MGREKHYGWTPHPWEKEILRENTKAVWGTAVRVWFWTFAVWAVLFYITVCWDEGTLVPLY